MPGEASGQHQAQRFLITPLPDSTVYDLPIYRVGNDVRLSEDGEWIEWNVSWSFFDDDDRPLHLPDEAYLREAHDIDLHDPEALLAFVIEHGSPGAMDWSDLGADDEASWWRMTNGVGRVEERVLGRLHRDAVAGVTDSLATRFFLHVDEIAMRLAVVRNCTAIWNAYDPAKERIDVEQIGPWYGGWHAEDRFRHTARPKTARDAAAYLGSTLTFALRPFSPTVLFEGIGWERAVDERVHSYTGFMRQLYNHMTERARYSICANEPCRRHFVRKRTGTVVAEQGRTSGRDYCSRSCQTSQNQRDYRRRKAAEKGRL